MMQRLKTENNLYASDVIVARATPQGNGAIGLIRFSGPGVFLLCEKFSHLSSGKALSALPSHTIHHGHIFDFAPDGTRKTVDEVLFLIMHAPRTFTGEDTLEITCHNNDFIIARIIALASSYGARHAKPGEFTQRAFISGKIDLLQAEAINDIITAPSLAAAELSLAQLEGSLSAKIREIETGLIHCQAVSEASFEFLDEEQRDIGFDEMVWERVTQLTETVKSVLRSSSRSLSLKRGVSVALIGAVNAGKSTLLNALVGQQRALVSDVAGTTRDTIEVTQESDGAFWTLVDTAGIRDTENEIEKAGIDRSYEQVVSADLIVLVYDSSRELSDEDARRYEQILADRGDRVIVVYNKCDAVDRGSKMNESLGSALGVQMTHTVSGKTGAGVEELRRAIEERVALIRGVDSGTFMITQRQVDILTDILHGLQAIQERYAPPRRVEYELLAYDLSLLIERITDLTGKNVNEKVMDTVFRSFCVGK